MLGWLCIVQSLWAYTPGVLAGAILLGLPPLVQARMLVVSHTKPLHDAVAQMADDLYGGYAPATPFSENTKVYRQSGRHRLFGALSYMCRFYPTSFSSSFSSNVIIINAVVINTAQIITAH